MIREGREDRRREGREFNNQNIKINKECFIYKYLVYNSSPSPSPHPHPENSAHNIRNLFRVTFLFIYIRYNIKAKRFG